MALLETILITLSRNDLWQERIFAEIVNQGFDLQNLDLQNAAKLPSLDQVVKESVRLAPPVPIIPHSPSADMTYRGWLIPQGSWVFANIWFVHCPTIHCIEKINETSVCKVDSA